MKEFTSEQLQEQFEKLPKDLQNAVSSTSVHDSIVGIGNKYGLHVDQLGEMVDLVGLIMLGLSPSKDFVANFSRETGVRSDVATSIAEDINKEVFDKIRSSMRMIESQEESTEDTMVNKSEAKNNQAISDLERAGGFTIEHSGQNGNGGAPINLPGAEEVTESREDLVAGIEDPAPMKPIMPTQEENHTEALVDRLLAGPMTAVEQKTVQTSPQEQATAKPEPKAPQTPPKPAGPDSYREPIQ
jgi:hypothetical protein